MDPTSRRVLANGLQHHVLEWDGGGTTTVLCLHGFLDLSWAFHQVAPRLAAAGDHVVAPDLRGPGETERVGAGGYYHFMDYVLDVADLADALGRERLALVGHSMGGHIVGYFAGAFPDRAWKAVLMEGIRVVELAPESMPRRVEEWIHGVRRAREHGPKLYRSVEDAAARMRAHDPRCPPDEALFLAARGTARVDGGWAYRHDPLHLTRAPYSFRTDHAMAFWRNVRCPVLLLDGSESERVPIDYPQRLACFGDRRHRVVEGAGHMMLRHRPEEVARAVLEFFSE